MPRRTVAAVAASGLTIYDAVPEALFLTKDELEVILADTLVGEFLAYKLRTRSKVAKQLVCKALGYPVPQTFKRVRPRFPGQDLDVHVQKSNNLQIWNDEISPTRRYAIVRLDANDRVIAVRVVSGEVLALYDRTGTLTQKFQARSRTPVACSVLVSSADTENVRLHAKGRRGLVPIRALFRRLRKLENLAIRDPGVDQERNRGSALHQRICRLVTKKPYSDHGQFPDIPDQLLEIKLQTSPTIDLGLVSPDDESELPDVPPFRHCDVRYAVYFGTPQGTTIRLRHLVLVTGAEFFSFFRRFEGKVRNKKLQIPLPSSLFD
ncbi:MAG TPA: hypothetical protein VML55_15095 [Planctomycetaceae bacterium]|nr:hypothetical protein [Planctomycetaceae bacterium]